MNNCVREYFLLYRYQFWPRNQHTATAKKYTKNLKIRFMVQARQFRKTHVDCHYASALYRYQREFCVKFRDYTTFVSQDDKHSVKVGEPDYPVAAVERGKAVLVGLNEKMVVGDHDFTKFTLTPSVNFLITIPETIEGSFYRGKVHVGLKDSIFEHSSPIKHAAELNKIFDSQERLLPPILVLYTDGGPDHRLTFVSVQLSLLALFIKLDLDFLCAVRTPPHNSWKNPAERIMSILNLALQGVGIVRAKTRYEDQLQKCNTMKQIRELAKSMHGLEQSIHDSLEPPITLLSNLFERLKLKEEPFSFFVPATNEEIKSLWGNIKLIDNSLEKDDTTKLRIQGKKQFLDFLNSHCKIRHYMFSVKKCGRFDCSICKIPRLPSDIFCNIHHLPDPISEGAKYKDFEDLYGSKTSEEHRPSLSCHGAKQHGMPFPPSAQYAKNVKVLLQCGECLKWRVLYSKHSLKKQQREELEILVENIEYSCGSVFTDIEGEEDSIQRSVFVKGNLTCNAPIEIPYFTAGYTPICYYCGDDDGLQKGLKYPVCLSCKGKTHTPNASK